MISNSMYGSGAVSDPTLDPGGMLEIEIEHETNPDGSVTIEFEPAEDAEAIEFKANLVSKIPEDKLATLCSDLIEQFETDLASRREWIRTYFKGLELVGLKTEDRTEPWPNACGVYHPMLTEAVVRFQSEVITETFPAMGPVKTTIVGEETKENLAAAQRVAEDMNYQLTTRMTEYRPEHERMRGPSHWQDLRSKRYTSMTRWSVRHRCLCRQRI